MLQAMILQDFQSQALLLICLESRILQAKAIYYNLKIQEHLLDTFKSK